MNSLEHEIRHYLRAGFGDCATATPDLVDGVLQRVRHRREQRRTLAGAGATACAAVAVVVVISTSVDRSPSPEPVRPASVVPSMPSAPPTRTQSVPISTPDPNTVHRSGQRTPAPPHRE